MEGSHRGQYSNDQGVLDSSAASYYKQKASEGSKHYRPNKGYRGGNHFLDQHPDGFCAMIRHGERADNVENVEALGIVIEEIQDPPLTPTGVQQSRETGAYLREYLGQNGYTKVVIASSPFLRALQTAAQVAKVLEIEEIQVNYLLTEWLKFEFFDSDPLNTLLIKNRDMKEISD